MEGSNDRQRVKVYVRLRPQLQNSFGAASADSSCNENVVETFDTTASTVRLKVEGGVSKLFHFDGCHGPESTQEEVYETSSKPLVQSVLEGYNASLVAYGMTGSGKTYTMLGKLEVSQQAGVIPRAIATIFEH